MNVVVFLHFATRPSDDMIYQSANFILPPPPPLACLLKKLIEQSWQRYTRTSYSDNAGFQHGARKQSQNAYLARKEIEVLPIPVEKAKRHLLKWLCRGRTSVPVHPCISLRAQLYGLLPCRLQHSIIYGGHERQHTILCCYKWQTATIRRSQGHRSAGKSAQE